MINWYEALKAQNRIPVDDRLAQLFGATTQGPVWKTITGVLPLTFTAKGGNAADWVIEGNDDVGKNLLKITATSSTISGVSYVANKNDGTIIANGTAQGNSTFQWNCELTAGSYVLSGCLSQGSNSTFGLNASLLDWSKTWWDYGSGTVINLSETTTVRVRVVIYNDTSVNNLVFKPMLRAVDTSPDFEPYQQGVGERTKNLFDEDDIELIQVGTNMYRSATSMGKLAAGTYILSFIKSDVNGVYITMRTGTSFVDAIAYSPHTFTVSDTVDEVIVRSSKQQVIPWRELGIYDIMLTSGSIPPSEYVQYGYQIPLTISQQGETDKSYNIYIGDSPLTEGETVSKSSTGVDIETFNGENVVSTTLYNKPTIDIKYK